MSTLSLVLVGFFGISTFSSILILAACVASGRSQKIVSEHTAKLSEHPSTNWYKRPRPMGSAGWLRSTNVTR